MMKNFIYSLGLTLVITGNVFSLDSQFEIDLMSSYVIEKLWQGNKVELREITEFVSLVAQQDHYNEASSSGYPISLKKNFQQFQENLLSLSEHREYTTTEIKNVNNFIDLLDKIIKENKYPESALNSTIEIIRSKY